MNSGLVARRVAIAIIVAAPAIPNLFVFINITNGGYLYLI